MSDRTVARRYAQALVQEAEREGHLRRIDEDIDLVRESLDASRDLVTFFESPIISREKKETVVKELFGGRLHTLTFNFLQLLIEKKREDLFPSVVRSYRDLRDEQLGVIEARVKAAQALSGDEMAELERALAKKTGRKVRLRVEVDPSLIGGLIVRVGDTVYDGSVQHQLETLREQLEHGTAALNGA